MSDTAVRTGSFRPEGSAKPHADMIRRIREDDVDWVQDGGMIAVRCWESPSSYNIVIARVEYQTEYYDEL